MPNMDVKIIEMTENQAKFLLSDANPEEANALRRVLISEVPKMAIETVEFHLGPIRDEEGNEFESVSPLFDEIVSHRLGLVPIPSDPSLFVTKDKCTCAGEGCPSCTIMYSLNKKGPCDVYSGDLEPLGSEDYRVKDQLIPIVRLGAGQAILVYASAELGIGKKHAKWQATSGVGYKYLPSVRIDFAKCDQGGTCIDVCPKKVFTKKEGKVSVENAAACTMCMACVEVCKTKAVKIEGDKTKFVFEFETDGSVTAKQALVKAFAILEQKFEDFRELVSTLEPA